MLLRSVFLTMLALSAGRAAAFLTAGSDVFYSGFGWPGHTEVLVKTHSYIFFGNESFGIGPVANYNNLRSDSKEFAYGGGVSFGSSFFVELDGLIYKITHRGSEGRGFQAAAILGWKLTPYLRLSIPIVYTAIQEGDFENQWKATFVPHVGLRFSL